MNPINDTIQPSLRAIVERVAGSHCKFFVTRLGFASSEAVLVENCTHYVTAQQLNDRK